ncbi:MAG TPA: FKBP-type peptidyl-prolyl cis-trans isomerase [Opitutaceae bacterium]|nr:FKBP-type peptidyl-prolyl cis-trans isomerase [Opitutaceae bacterium]
MKIFRFIAGVLLLAAPLALHAQREKLPPEDLAIVEKQWPEAKKTSTGLRYIILKEGEGDPARPGDLVSVLYRGAILNGKVFDKADDPNQPFTFRLGRSQVIQGWDQGLQLLKKGGKMLLIIPSELGYGSRGNGPEIPRYATLVFEIEMLDLKREMPLPSMLPQPSAKKK